MLTDFSNLNFLRILPMPNNPSFPLFICVVKLAFGDGIALALPEATTLEEAVEEAKRRFPSLPFSILEAKNEAQAQKIYNIFLGNE